MFPILANWLTLAVLRYVLRNAFRGNHIERAKNIAGRLICYALRTSSLTHLIPPGDSVARELGKPRSTALSMKCGERQFGDALKKGGPRPRLFMDQTPTRSQLHHAAGPRIGQPDNDLRYSFFLKHTKLTVALNGPIIRGCAPFRAPDCNRRKTTVTRASPSSRDS